MKEHPVKTALWIFLAAVFVFLPVAAVVWWVVRHELRTWSPDDTLSISIGGGFLLVAAVVSAVMIRRDSRRRGQRWGGF